MTNFTLSPTFDAANASQKAELLLRRLGVRRNLVGFDYTVYMSVQVAANPSSLQLITKRLYRETAKQFHTTPNKALLAKRILLCSLFAGKETG